VLFLHIQVLEFPYSIIDAWNVNMLENKILGLNIAITANSTPVLRTSLFPPSVIEKEQETTISFVISLNLGLQSLVLT
jgi:hypothetical protein